MSELYDFQLLSVEGPTARFLAETVHCDAYVIPASKNFALR